jgi:NADH:ubiquinone oxidoreductase subunit E
MEMEKIDTILEQNGYNRAGLIPILQDIQAEYKYLPQEALSYVAKKLDVPLIDVFCVASFFKSFSLTPRGKHIVTVCLGTACHVKGAPSIVDEIERKICIRPGQNSEDGQFTLETVNCLGACALAPIVVVDGEYYGQTTMKKVGTILRKYQKSQEEEQER